MVGLAASTNVIKENLKVCSRKSSPKVVFSNNTHYDVIIGVHWYVIY